MRLYLLLILLALGMAFITGYSVYVLEGKSEGSRENRIEIRRLTQRYFINHKSLFSLDSEIFIKSKDVLDLVLPQKIEGFKQAKPFYSTNKDCLNSKDKKSSKKDIMNKESLWGEYRCNQDRPLPRTFFFRSPFIHPSGYSYTYLAFKTGRKEFQSKRWLQKHVFYFHIRELKDLKKAGIKITPGQTILSELSDQGIDSLLKEESIIANEKFILRKDSGLMSLFYPRYLVYSFPDFQRFIKKTKYLVSIGDEKSDCLIRDRNLCWNYSLKEYLKVVGKTNLVFFVLGITSVMVILLILILRIRQGKIEDDKRKLALRVLSHEFRTPVTSMILTLENLSKNNQDMDDDLLEDILKLSSDAYRLRRLVESSKNYIDLNQKEIMDRKKFNEVNLKTFVEDLCFSIGHEPIIQINDDLIFLSDGYWLSICLKNLIENAYKHGVSPIIVRAYQKNKKVFIEIEDQGHDDSISLENLTQAFVKGNKSEGSGLGLNIVHQVVHDLGGRLNLLTSPTIFQMIFPIKEKK